MLFVILPPYGCLSDECWPEPYKDFLVITRFRRNLQRIKAKRNSSNSRLLNNKDMLRNSLCSLYNIYNNLLYNTYFVYFLFVES